MSKTLLVPGIQVLSKYAIFGSCPVGEYFDQERYDVMMKRAKQEIDLGREIYFESGPKSSYVTVEES